MSSTPLQPSGPAQAAPPPQPQPATQPAAADPEDDAKRESNQKVVAGRDMTAEELHIYSIAGDFVAGGVGPKIFSAPQPWPIGTAIIEQITRVFVGNDGVPERLLAHLEKRRVLLLTGDRGTGKTTAAYYLSARISALRQLAEPQVVGPLTRQMSVDIRKVAGTKKDFGNRATVFTDAFARQNHELLGFFSETDDIGWQQLTETLADNNAYLIFTASPNDVSAFRQQVARHAVCEELAVLTPQKVSEAIDRKIAWLRVAEPHKAALLDEIDRERARIISELTTVTQVASLVDDFLLGDTDLDNALRRTKNVHYWFTGALPADIDAWCFVLTLTLAQATVGSQSVSWFEFEHLRRAITAHIRGDTELFPRRRRAADGTDDSRETAAESLADDLLLSRCRAVIVKDIYRLSDAVRFLDPSYGAQIWQIILVHHRRILTSLLPLLRTIAEEERGPGSFPIRILAAQMLGRMGEIDPSNVTLPLVLRHWMAPDQRSQRPLIGRLMQGVLASTSETYREVVLHAVAMIAQPSPMSDSNDAKDRLLTAIGTYSQIGVYDPDFAMDRLGQIALTRLSPAMENIHQISRLKEKVDRHLSRRNTPRTAEDLLVHEIRKRLGRAEQRLSADHAATLVGLERAVVYLCLVNNPIDIIDGMRDWISKGGPQTGILVALLFLQDGIADQLELLPADFRDDAAISPILASLAASEASIGRLCSFLADIYASINSTFSLPAGLQLEFQEAFTDCLTMWAVNAVASGNAPVRTAVENLIVALTLARDGAMRRDIYLMLGGPAFQENDAVRTFASNVRKRL